MKQSIGEKSLRNQSIPNQSLPLIQKQDTKMKKGLGSKKNSMNVILASKSPKKSLTNLEMDSQMNQSRILNTLNNSIESGLETSTRYPEILENPEGGEEAVASIPTTAEILLRNAEKEEKKKKKKRKLIMDGYMIMQKYKLSSPDQVTKIVIRNNNLYDVFEDDMPYFSNLSELDLTDNEVPLWKLRNLRGIQKLNLSFNRMQILEIYPLKEMVVGFPLTSIGYFKSLTHLNLSFNNIEAESLENLQLISESLE